MDTALAPEAAVVPAATEPSTTEPNKPLEVAEFVHKLYEKHEGEAAALESGTTETPVVAEAEVPAADAAAATTEPAKQDASQPPFTVEELGDPAFLGRLDKDGWSKLETFNPALYKAAKAVAHAQGTVFELKRRLESQAPPERPKEPEVDPYVEALAKTDSLDATERADGFRTLARLEAQKLLAETAAAESNTPEAVERAAYRTAVAAMPSLSEIPTTELDAAVEASPDLMDDLDFAGKLEGTARVRALSKLIQRAGKIVLGNKVAAKTAADAETVRKAKEAKDADVQKRLRSNQSNASTTVATTPGGATPKGELSIEETIHRKVAALPA